MSQAQLTASEICAKGRENLNRMGIDWVYPGGKMGPSVKANRRYLDSLFFRTRLFDPVDVDSSLSILRVKLRTPAFCSAISKLPHMSETGIAEIARGISNVGSLVTLGIGGTSELQSAIDTGAHVVKMVKPYRNTELIYEKVHDAESRGCVAVGMDIDHFYGLLRDGRVDRTELFGPQSTNELRQLISETKLPFIIKGVLSVRDAEKAAALGASAVVVSNHGSGAFDFSVPSLIALPEIAASVGSKLDVLIDTGFETGNDVFKALALGAKAVGFANSIILAHAADGSRGAELLIASITAELQRTMAATGCANLSAINRSIIIQVPHIEE